MRNSFNFLKNYYEIAQTLSEKNRLIFYDLVMKLNFFCFENETELEQFCSEIESDLKQNRKVLVAFLGVKFSILKSVKGYIARENGNSKQADLPKVVSKVVADKIENKKIENIKEENNKIENINLKEKEKEKEKVIFPFLKNYEKVFLNIPLLDEKAKSKIVELSENIPNFEEVSKSVFQKLKHVSWTFRDGTKPNIVWLLRDSNFITLANSQDTKKQEQDLDTLLDNVLGDLNSG